jgi:hypothetical protein
MLLNPELMRLHLQEVADVKVWETYLAFGFARVANGMTIRPAAHGYIARELRFETSGTWYFSAVLNKRWVL